jgi:hypothetical protein
MYLGMAVHANEPTFASGEIPLSSTVPVHFLLSPISEMRVRIEHYHEIRM